VVAADAGVDVGSDCDAAAASLTTLLTSGFWCMQSVLRTVTGTKLLCCALIDFFRVLVKAKENSANIGCENFKKRAR